MLRHSSIPEQDYRQMPSPVCQNRHPALLPGVRAALASVLGLGQKSLKDLEGRSTRSSGSGAASQAFRNGSAESRAEEALDAHPGAWDGRGPPRRPPKPHRNAEWSRERRAA